LPYRKPAELRRAAFGLRQILRFSKALFGSSVGDSLDVIVGHNFRCFSGLLSIPGLLAVVMLHVGVKEGLI